MELYLVRHGICRHNMTDSASVLDDPFCSTALPHDREVLIPQGVLQAELTGFFLRDVPFDAVYSSGLIRAVQTAACILKFQKEEKCLHILPDLAEEGYFTEKLPDLENHGFTTVWRNAELPTNPSATGLARVTDDELPPDIRRRADNMARFLLERHKNDANVLAVSHGAFLYQYLIPALLGDHMSAMRIDASNCGITVLHFRENGEVTVETANDIGHLGTAAY